MANTSNARPDLRALPDFALDVKAAKELHKRLFPNAPDDERIANFFEVLGRAISAWQLVETALYEVYERAVAPMRPGACGASFHAIQTFNMKLGVTDAAVAFALIADPAALKEWEKISKHASEKSQRRNEFAHFATYVFMDEKKADNKLALEPIMYDWRHLNKKKRPRYKMSEIAHITNRFVDVANKIRRFTQKIPGAKS